MKNKIIITIGAVALVALLLWFAERNKNIELQKNVVALRQTMQENNLSGYELVNPLGQDYGQCNKRECLFRKEDVTLGYGTLEGYFTQRTMPDETVCSAFLVKRGSTALIDHFRTMVEGGNMINAINENGELVIVIDEEGLGEDGEEITQSRTSQQMVELRVVRGNPIASSAPECFSFVDIIAVE